MDKALLRWGLENSESSELKASCERAKQWVSVSRIAEDNFYACMFQWLTPTAVLGSGVD